MKRILCLIIERGEQSEEVGEEVREKGEAEDFCPVFLKLQYVCL